MNAPETSDVSTFALDVFAASGKSGDRALADHVAGCARCRAYLDGLEVLAAGSRPIPARRRRSAVPVAFALAIAAGVAIFIATKGKERDNYVGIKGGTPAVQILLHRERTTRIWDGQTPVRPGDTLALRVACEGMKHVAVAAPSGGGWGPLSRTPCTEGDAPLPFTLRVDDAPGDENLAVVLSRDELADDALGAAVAENRRAADVWVVRYVLPKQTEGAP
jgi:hypothetical protein